MEVAKNIYWLRMPLPFALDHINLWLLRDQIDEKNGWTIIDCGIDNQATKALWQQLIDNELEGLPILRVIVTHAHPDHIGLASWLCPGGEHTQWQAPLWISLIDYFLASQAGKIYALNKKYQSDLLSPDSIAAANHFAAHGLKDFEFRTH
ncbi:hypothetical protein ACTFIZ_012353 [Dictyostelium cf. discoideum]